MSLVFLNVSRFKAIFNHAWMSREMLYKIFLWSRKNEVFGEQRWDEMSGNVKGRLYRAVWTRK